MDRFGFAPDVLRIEPAPLEIEFTVFGPDAAHEVQPFGGVFVAYIVFFPIRTEHLELVLKPPANDVQRKAPAGNVVDRRALFGRGDRVRQRYVRSREYAGIVRHGGHAGGQRCGGTSGGGGPELRRDRCPQVGATCGVSGEALGGARRGGGGGAR